MDDLKDIIRRLRIIEEELSYATAEYVMERGEAKTVLLKEAYDEIISAKNKLSEFVELGKNRNY